MYLSYFGIRVTDLRRSADFYSRHFGLRPADGSEFPHAPVQTQAALLLVDPVSGQRLELNFYPPGTPYAVPYVPGEGWDHLAFRVDDLPALLDRLASDGVYPRPMKHFGGPMLSTPTFRAAYVLDPDGNEIELFDSPGADPLVYNREAY